MNQTTGTGIGTSDHARLLDGLTRTISDYYLVEGGSYQINAQVERLRELVASVAASGPKAIMEIGFNAGHSALLFLAITPPETKVVSFDLGEYAYVFAAKRYIDSVFPGRHTLVTGDSTFTIPNYEEQVAHRMNNPNSAPPHRFDLIFIDGGHQDDIPLKDIMNSQRLARSPDTIVAIDDICRVPTRHAHYTVEPTKAWEQMIDAGFIREDGFDDYYDIMTRTNEKGVEQCRARGMAWGKYQGTSIPSLNNLMSIRYKYYQKTSKYMDRNQMLQEIHNQYHHYKDHHKLVAIADMYLDYFPTYNQRDTNYVRFYRACSNFVINPAMAVKQYEEIVDTPVPGSVPATATNDNDSELPKFITNASIANLGLLYPKDPCAEIPKVIHLLYFGETDFHNFHHRCVHSMLQYMPDYEIRIYNATEPVGNPLWNDLKQYSPRITILSITPPTHYDGFELKHFQYKADVVRLELLYEHGGVYLDLDMLITRPFHDVFASGHSFYISEERSNTIFPTGNTGAGGALINAFLAAKPKNEFVKLWLNEFKSGLRLGIWATHIRDSNRKLLDDHPHYVYKYRVKVLDGKLFMPLHWQDTVAFIQSETIPHAFPEESYGTHLWETILGDVMRKNEFLKKEKMELTVYSSRSSPFYCGPPVTEDDNDDDLTIYPEYYHECRNDQYVDKYITKGKHGGYFIEIGGGNGETNSSCYFFERHREWRGIVVEPAQIYHASLQTLRKTVIHAAVSNVTSSFTNGSGRGAIFYECVLNAGLSGLKSVLENHKEGGEWTHHGVKSYKVDTVTLYDLCCERGVPEQIDYCAIDSNGCEYEILSTFFEENQASPAHDGGMCAPPERGEVGLIVTNKVFQIGFFSIDVGSDKTYQKLSSLMKKHNYEESLNPYLSVIERRENSPIRAYYMYKGTGATNSPQLSDSSLSTISSGANYTPHATTTPPPSPIANSVSASFLLRPPFAAEVVVICLEERPERTRYVSDHLRSHGIQHTLLMNKIHTEDTKVGCFRSHIKAIQYAQSKNLSSVLIVEDDIVIRDNINELSRIALPGGSGGSGGDDAWDILYLGGILTRYDGMDPTHKWVNGTIWCNHAYLVKQRMYQPILDFVASYPNLIELERKNIDFMYTEYIQPKYNCWLANDQYIIQKEGYSEIDCRVKWANGFDWSTFSMKVI